MAHHFVHHVFYAVEFVEYVAEPWVTASFFAFPPAFAQDFHFFFLEYGLAFKVEYKVYHHTQIYKHNINAIVSVVFGIICSLHLA